MASSGGQPFGFEGFTLDLTRGCLLGATGEIELRPKSFELLRYLVENAGRLISKDELVSAVWPNVIVSDDSLAQCVSELRQALGDPGRRIIKTVPRRGYLFAAPLSVQARDSPVRRPSTRGPNDTDLAPGFVPSGRGNEMPVTRRLTAILAADVAGYSRLMGVDEEGTHERLKGHLRELIEPKIQEHRGRIVKNTGDGFLAEFASVVDAVRCSVEIQRRMADREAGVPGDQRIRFRIGVNLGDVIVEEQDLFGDGVNVAARLETLAEPGEICVSRVVRDQVRDKVDFGFEDLGEQQVKNIARPVHAYHILLEERSAPNRSPPLPDAPSLAVLPFQNMTGDAEQEYFVDGVVDEITTAISRLPWLFVIARNSSFTYKDRAVDVKQVARELGVRYVLEGSVRKAGHRVRITGQLIDTTTGSHIWAERFDRTLDDIFELQDQVASSVVGAIEPRLRLSEIKRVARKPATSLDVYDLYLRALALLHKFTDQDCQEAIQLLKEALAIEPSYAPAAAMIGWCRWHQVTLPWGQISEVEIEEGVRLARQAIEAGKDDPEALWMAGYTLSVLAGEYATASTAINRALALNPNSAHALGASGLVSCFQNKAALAIEAIHRAMRLSPLDPLSYRFSALLGLAHLIARDYEEAMVWVDGSLRELPRYTVAVRMKVVLCAHLGRMEEAKDWLARLLQLQPDLTIARYKAYAAGLFRHSPEILAIFVEGLRNAGLPEE